MTGWLSALLSSLLAVLLAAISALVAFLHPVAPIPAPAPVHATTTTTAPPPSTVAPSVSPIWACIIRHESGGNPQAVNRSSGASGLVQFMPSTFWATARHAGRPDLIGVPPQNASAADQMAMAYALQAWQGWGPWRGDGCV